MATFSVEAELAGVVFRIDSAVGTMLQEGDTILTLESMKMEIPVCATEAGTLLELTVAEGQSVQAGEVIARLSK